jgi:BR-signaling kinase
MGCCESSFLTETHPEKEQNQTQHQTQLNVQTQPPTFGAESVPIGGVPSFSEFSFSDLKAATNKKKPAYNKQSPSWIGESEKNDLCK